MRPPCSDSITLDVAVWSVVNTVLIERNRISRLTLLLCLDSNARGNHGHSDIADTLSEKIYRQSCATPAGRDEK